MIMEKTLNKCINNMMDEMIFAIAVQNSLVLFDIINEELEQKIMKKTLDNSQNNLMNNIIL